MTIRRDPPIPPQAAQSAIEWLVDLRAEHVAPDTLDAWRRWRAAHPDHERAWQRIESINGKLGHLATPVNAALARATLSAPASPRRRQIIAGLAALLFAGGTGWHLYRDEPWRAWNADQRTASGERRRIQLDDGTTVTMNSGSALNLAYSATERRLRLLAGEVLITTASDAANRPFVVDTAQGEALALGTRYTVRQLSGATDVAVFEGSVRITPRNAPALPLLLQAGQQTRFSADTPGQPAAADPDNAAWSDGFIIAKGLRLDDFLAELNRHSRRPLGCDPAVAHLRVSGTYPLDDVDKILDTLAATLSLRVETLTRFWEPWTERVNLALR
ncbi:MAG: FecR domain-containing protein [Porticoccaceae bacterium]